MVSAAAFTVAVFQHPECHKATFKYEDDEQKYGDSKMMQYIHISLFKSILYVIDFISVSTCQSYSSIKLTYISGCLLCSFLERPIKFLQDVKNIQVQEGGVVTLCCELSQPGVPVQWTKGDTVLSNGDKYQIKQSSCIHELHIRKSLPEDSGTYSCICDEIKSTATTIITGEMRSATSFTGRS